MEQFKFYIVGGYVRDKLLGKNPKDIDYTVVSMIDETNINIYEKILSIFIRS